MNCESMIRSCIGILACTVLVAACASSTKMGGDERIEESDARPVTAPTLVGRVASVPRGSGFLLIESYGEWSIADGTVLIARGMDDRSANLRVTGERLGRYAAADIQAGEAAEGDSVFLLPAAGIEQAFSLEKKIEEAGEASGS